ncbi:MAG: TIGR02391 family protein [Armatimonadota bacterium]|nr:TIGR02391 family protein [Armatimonadota bacterium]MDR7569196.1 TIGR02391 family protein [Armatimonadota bacterium]MDR7613314.1 TIGR02391 family protein [Armatimonadota bacterium]
MVPVDFYHYRRELRQALLRELEVLKDRWDPFAAAWLGYALSVEGTENNQPFEELVLKIRKWVEEEQVWDVHRNVGPIAAAFWLNRKAGRSLELEPEWFARLSDKVQQLGADDRWSPLRDPEQVFLLSLGFQAMGSDRGGECLQAILKTKEISKREMGRGPLYRRILYAAALRELGDDVSRPQGEPQDEADIIARVWWAERYGGNKREDWERFGSVQERIVFDEGVLLSQRVLSPTEKALLYEAIVRETEHPDPQLLFDYFPLHRRVKQAAEGYFRAGKFVGAVFEATKVLNEEIQKRSGIWDKNEAELVQATMKQIGEPAKLRIRFNAHLDKESGKNEQAGLALICEGVFKAFRNPKGHLPENHELVRLDPYEVLHQLIVINYLLWRIENASAYMEGETDA